MLRLGYAHSVGEHHLPKGEKHATVLQFFCVNKAYTTQKWALELYNRCKRCHIRAVPASIDSSFNRNLFMLSVTADGHRGFLPKHR